MHFGGKELYVLQCVLFIPEQMPFYGVIWGYFDLIKVGLKVMPRPCDSGSKQILIGLSNGLLYLNLLAQTVAKLQAHKVGGQKNF